MKVSEIPYEHIALDEIRSAIEAIVKKIRAANSADEVLACREEYLKISTRVKTAHTLSYIRYTLNTADPFYEKEKDYFDEIEPTIATLNNSFGEALLSSPFRAELEQRLSPLYFKYLEVRRRASSKEIEPDMVEENRIVSEYTKLMAGLEFTFRGKTMSRAELAGFFKSEDRATRKEAYEIFGTVMNTVKDRLDDIFDRLVKVRTRMARKLGYENFIGLGYNRMDRVSYGREEVETFRRNILRDIVPVVAKLRTENAKELGIDKFMLYDLGVIVKGGDPKPIGGKEEIFAAAEAMYHEMSDESARFIDMMLENDAFDVESRKNKWGGGYTEDIPAYKQPFILANFNGTADDVDVMTHEAGHAFNSYLIADNRFALEISCGGMETAEIHSMSMEFFAWKYMENFFGGNVNQYCFMHALDAFSFLPYGTIVDAFQHIVYENPDMTPAERCEAWNKLEKEYRPFLSTEGMPFLEEGRRWQYQMHIYEVPFYYIDYVLAQTVAFAFLLASQEDYDDAFSRYIRLMKHSGELEYPELVRESGMPFPFEDGALAGLAEKVAKLLETRKAMLR